MRLFGVEIKHPSPKELGIAAFVIFVFLAISLGISAINGQTAVNLFPSLVAVTSGAVSASFGISPAKGWRACLMLIAIGTICYAIVTVLMKLTGE